MGYCCEGGTEPSELALRKPQLALAKQTATAAKGALIAAELNSPERGFGPRSMPWCWKRTSTSAKSLDRVGRLRPGRDGPAVGQRLLAPR